MPQQAVCDLLPQQLWAMSEQIALQAEGPGDGFQGRARADGQGRSRFGEQSGQIGPQGVDPTEAEPAPTAAVAELDAVDHSGLPFEETEVVE